MSWVKAELSPETESLRKQADVCSQAWYVPPPPAVPTVNADSQKMCSRVGCAEWIVHPCLKVIWNWKWLDRIACCQLWKLESKGNMDLCVSMLHNASLLNQRGGLKAVCYGKVIPWDPITSSLSQPLWESMLSTILTWHGISCALTVKGAYVSGSILNVRRQNNSYNMWAKWK